MNDYAHLVDADKLVFKPNPDVICPKHGQHSHTITSNISGHEGTWCMKCALELLGPSLPTVEKENE
ncbi:MAG: hypothetical protein EBU90_21665 [Proteobacteria bacterium]|nr:hypothetical protein [Pseudomonadota bacterium]